jgi:hypothetical protein|tara:strand:- start:9625 stop:9852 length:228 start_codon:yes stop_codon:yes gene_type:complete
VINLSRHWDDRCVSGNGKPKVAYTQAQAEAAMRNQPGKNLQCYLCTQCGMFHLAASRTMKAKEYNYNILAGWLNE